MAIEGNGGEYGQIIYMYENAKMKPVILGSIC